ncbi:MAG TPA: NADH-quinone oxidoreductase subunit N [Solibacterales bacterium]|nr:NADH-quinone oxidoreductase subunit N [Bryobacterales bacterium]
MPANFIPSAAELLRFLPEMILTVAGVLLMMLVPLKRNARGLFYGLTLAALVLSLAASVAAFGDPGPAFQNMLLIDGFATFFRVLVIGVGILTVSMSNMYLARERAESGEYYALLLFSLVGQSIMVSANEMIMLFIGLEVSSIATYIMAGYLRDDKRNNESALKYFLLGSFATAFLLYGIAWIYGLTGTTNLTEIRAVLLNPDIQPSLMIVGAAAAMMFVGFAFKISAAPFQVWAPDVYQGAPAPVSAFMSAGPKAAAFAIFLRVFLTAFQPIADRWEPIVWLSALLTMIVGNFAALAQSNVKRLLAYSSIAHAGYVMVALVSNSQVGTAAAMFYLVAYAFMNIGAFAVVTHIARKGERYVRIEDLAGLGVRQAGTAALLSIFLLSLIGVPLTAGFFGKFYIFKAALDSNLVWLTILGLLNSAVAAYYYLRILVVMYMQDPAQSTENLPELAPGIKATLWTSAAATLVLGVFPSLALDFARQSAQLVK